MGDEQVAQSQLPLQVDHEVQDLRLHRDVEGRDGLVGHHQIGLQGQGPGEANSLALAAAELVRVAVGVLGAQAHGLQQPAHLDPQRFPFRPL